MQCKGCNYPDSRVVYSRHRYRVDQIDRRRECLRCGKRFTTREEEVHADRKRDNKES